MSERIDAIRERLADEMREIVLDVLRGQEPDDWDPDDGTDESAWQEAYLLLADRALTIVGASERRLREALALAYTALERAQPDSHDRTWYMDTVIPTLRRVLRSDSTPLGGSTEETRPT